MNIHFYDFTIFITIYVSLLVYWIYYVCSVVLDWILIFIAGVNNLQLGTVGDFIGGILNPIFGAISLIFLIKTLNSQRKSVNDQESNFKTQLDNQKQQIEYEKFESRFFELLRIHRQNVTDMQINCVDGSIIEGNKAILWMFRELMYTHKFIKSRMDLTNLNNNEILELSYYCFAFGAGDRSTYILKNYFKKISKYKSLDFNLLTSYLTNSSERKIFQRENKMRYKPFGGQQSRLGHYYRNLYYIVMQVENSKILNNCQKNEYIKHLKVQLNTYEQALLVINSLTVLGKEWKPLIIKYKLVSNIPIDFFSPSEFDVISYISTLIDDFYPDKLPYETKKIKDEFFEYYKHFDM